MRPMYYLKQIRLSAALSMALFALAAQAVEFGAVTQSTLPTRDTSTGTSSPALSAARDLLLRGEEQQAIPLLQKLVAQQPPPPDARRILGIAYYRLGKLIDALSSFAAASAQNPEDMEALQMQGLTLYRLGRAEDALPLLERTRGFSGTADMDTNYVIGRCYIDVHRYDDARVAFAAQYGLNPLSAQAYVLNAQLLLTLELPEPAATAAQNALQLANGIPMAHFVLGKVHMAHGNFQRALSEFEQERTVNPAYPPLYQFLGDLYLRSGDLAPAQRALTQALSLDTASTGPFILMGRLFLEKHDYRTAASYLEHAEQMDPGNYITHYMLGQAYRQLGRTDDAKRELEIVSKAHANEIRSQQ